MTPKPRPKVQAAAGGGAAVVVVLYALRLVGVDTDGVPPEVVAVAGGGIATLAAYVKRDGLAGAWDRIVRGANSPAE